MITMFFALRGYIYVLEKYCYRILYKPMYHNYNPTWHVQPEMVLDRMLPIEIARTAQILDSQNKHTTHKHNVDDTNM